MGSTLTPGPSPGQGRGEFRRGAVCRGGNAVASGPTSVVSGNPFPETSVTLDLRLWTCMSNRLWDSGPSKAEENDFTQRMHGRHGRPGRRSPRTSGRNWATSSDQGRVREAVVHYRKAVEMERDNPGYHTRLGDAYVYSDLSVEAVAEYPEGHSDQPPARRTALQPG